MRPSRLPIALAVTCVALGAAVSAQFGRGGIRAVIVPAADGRTISGLLVEARQRPAPAVVLVPMLGRSKDDWRPVADRLADAGISALAVDLPSRELPADPGELVAWHTVVTGALDYLAGRPEVRASGLGVAGASLGANLAAVAAASDLRIRSLALISPSLDYRGVRIERALEQYGERPAWLLASLGDPYAARSVRALAEGAPGLRETLWADTPAHGTVLLARDPGLVRSLVAWFQRTLG